jgi:hypothetical protein
LAKNREIKTRDDIINLAQRDQAYLINQTLRRGVKKLKRALIGNSASKLGTRALPDIEIKFWRGDFGWDLHSCFNPDQLAIQHSRRYQTPEAAVFQAIRSSPPHLFTDSVANQSVWKRSIPSLGDAGVASTGAVYARGYPRD